MHSSIFFLLAHLKQINKHIYLIMHPHLIHKILIKRQSDRFICSGFDDWSTVLGQICSQQAVNETFSDLGKSSKSKCTAANSLQGIVRRWKYRVLFCHCHTRLDYKTFKKILSDVGFRLKLMVTLAHFDIWPLENIFLIILAKIFLQFTFKLSFRPG